MAFLIIVLAIHFILELVNKPKTEKIEITEEVTEDINTFHPAEFNLRNL